MMKFLFWTGTTVTRLMSCVSLVHRDKSSTWQLTMEEGIMTVVSFKTARFGRNLKFRNNFHSRVQFFLVTVDILFVNGWSLHFLEIQKIQRARGSTVHTAKHGALLNKHLVFWKPDFIVWRLGWGSRTWLLLPKLLLLAGFSITFVCYMVKSLALTTCNWMDQINTLKLFLQILTAGNSAADFKFWTTSSALKETDRIFTYCQHQNQKTWPLHPFIRFGYALTEVKLWVFHHGKNILSKWFLFCFVRVKNLNKT